MFVLLLTGEILGSKSSKTPQHPNWQAFKEDQQPQYQSVVAWTFFLYAAVRSVCRYVHTRMPSAMISVRISSACRYWMKSSSTTSCLHRAVERFRRALLSRSNMPHWNIFLGHTGDKDTGELNGWQTGSAQFAASNVDDFGYDCFGITSRREVSDATLSSSVVFKKAAEARRLGV